MSLIVSIVGLPGAGKSTVAKAVADELGVATFSAGERLRTLAQSDPALATALAEGQLGPEDLVTRMVDEFVAQSSVAILDGYPRHRSQAEHLLGQAGRMLIAHLAIEPDLAIARIRQRPQRGDDTDAAIQLRIARDAAALREVLGTLAAFVFQCDARRPVPQITADILAKIRL